VEHLGICEWLLERGGSVPPLVGLNLPPEFDTYPFEQHDLGRVHRRILESPPRRAKALRIKGALPTEIVLPFYRDVPTSAKFAWRLAWLDRLDAWEGRRVVFESSRSGSLPLFLQARSAAQGAPADWGRLFAGCLAIAEYLLTILRRGGLGPAFRFSPS
jgi:hypothetical protein